MKLLHPKIHTIAIKDFTWQQEGPKWAVKSVPVGQGIVNYPEYLKLVDKYQINRLATMHFEYPLGGAENGAQKLTISSEEFKKSIIQDLHTFRKLLGK